MDAKETLLIVSPYIKLDNYLKIYLTSIKTIQKLIYC